MATAPVTGASNSARLIQNTQPIPCHFKPLCRCRSTAKWILAVGPRTPLWLPLGDECMKSMLGSLHTDLAPLAVAALVAAGYDVIAPGEIAQPVPADIPQEAVLAYIQEHAQDDGFLEVLTPQAQSIEVKRAMALALLDALKDDGEFLAAVAGVLEGPPAEGHDPAEVTGLTAVTAGTPEAMAQRVEEHLADERRQATLKGITDEDGAPAHQCVCGWAPPADHQNKEAALRGHQSRCLTAKAAKGAK